MLRLLILVTLAGCTPDSFGARAVELGILPQASTIQGRDGGPSGLVWGHSVWSFGDTVLNQNDVEGTNWHHNSFSITDDLAGRDGSTASPSAATRRELRATSSPRRPRRRSSTPSTAAIPA